MIDPTKSPSIPVARLHVGWMLKRASMGGLLALSVEVELGATLDAIKGSDGTAGAPFNAGNGGVVVMLWDDTQLIFWRFARDEIPQDIEDGCPDPDSWGTPVARWTGDSCDIGKSFQDMQRMSHPLRSFGCNIGKLCFFFQW